MKKNKYLVSQLVAFLLLIGLFSCSEDSLIEPVRPIEIIATINNSSDSRVSHADNIRSISARWEEGDTIGLISADGSLANVPLVAIGSGMETSFRPIDGSSFEIPRNTDIYAYYPYNKANPGNTTVAIAPGILKTSWYGNQYTVIEEGEPIVCIESDSDINGLYDFLYCKALVDDNTVRLGFEHLLSFLKVKFHGSDLIEGGKIVPRISMRIWNDTDERYSHDDLNCVDSISFATGQIIIGRNGIAGKSIDLSALEYQDLQTAEARNKGIIAYIPIIPKSLRTDRNRFEFFACERGNDGNDKELHDKLLGIFPIPKNGLKAGYVYSAEAEKNYSENLMRLQREALEALYKATDGENWTNNDGWLTDAPLCEWYGVLTNDQTSSHYMYGSHDVEYVTELRLNNNNLNGFLPSELAKLSMLSYIDVNRNNIKLNGSFHWLSDIDHDLFINASNCELSGKFIDEIPVINEHMGLDLSHNNLNGPLPEVEAPLLDAIYENISVNLSYNKLSGTIPESWTKFYPEDIKPWDFLNRYPDYNSSIRRQRFNIEYNCLEGKLSENLINKVPYRDYIFQNTEYEADRNYSFDVFPIVMPRKVEGSDIDYFKEYVSHSYTLVYSFLVDFVSDNELYMVSQLAKQYEGRGLCVILHSDKELSVSRKKLFTKNTKMFVESYEVGVNKPVKFIWGQFFIWQGGPSYFTLIDSKGNLAASHPFYCTDYGHLQFPQLFVNDIFNHIAQLFGDDEFDVSVPDMYASTDFKSDGEVVVLQKATCGNGVDIVLMGNGYVDKEIADGTYERIMRLEMEGLFSYEPYKSLRNRFNVYMVKAVSLNNVWIDGSKHAMDGDDGISLDKVFDYASKAPIKGSPQVGLIYNIGENTNIGRSYTAMDLEGAFVAVLLDNDPDVFTHEVGGHGLGKLADEYSEYLVDDSDMPDEINALESFWREKGWYLNVDYRSDPDKVNWKHFLADSRYAAEELGVFAGAYAKDTHFYRPSTNSMMNSNRSPFNAPSRELIYKRIMQASEGADWKYDFEEFYIFDRKNIVKDSYIWKLPHSHGGDLSEKTMPPKIMRSLKGKYLPKVSE